MSSYAEFYFDTLIYFHLALLSTKPVLFLFNFPDRRYCRLCVLRLAHNYATFFVVETVSVYSAVGTRCLILLYKFLVSDP